MYVAIAPKTKLNKDRCAIDWFTIRFENDTADGMRHFTGVDLGIDSSGRSWRNNYFLQHRVVCSDVNMCRSAWCLGKHVDSVVAGGI